MGAPQFRQALMARARGETFEYEQAPSVERVGRDSSPGLRRSRYRWGYLRITARYARRSCEACGSVIEKGSACWWHPTIRSLRCLAVDCEPSRETAEQNEIVVWYVREGQFEEYEYTDDELEKIEENRRHSGEGFVGVVVFADDCVEAEVDEEPGSGWRRAADPGKGEELPSFSTSREKDARNVRDLSDPNELLTKSAGELVADLDPTIRHAVWNSHKRSAGRFDRDDLRGVVLEKLAEAMPKYDGRGAFGAFVDPVISRALVDYARRELKYEKHHISLPDEDGLEGVGCDPTDDWVARLDVAALVGEVPNASLVVLKEAGFASRELGEPGVIDSRASRARIALRDRLMAGGYGSNMVANAGSDPPPQMPL